MRPRREVGAGPWHVTGASVLASTVGLADLVWVVGSTDAVFAAALVHRRSTRPVAVSRGGPAVLTMGHPVRHAVVKACGCPAEILSLAMRVHSVGSTVWQPSKCRVAHQGTMQAWGWCTRYAKPYQCWDSLLEPVSQLIQNLWHELPPDVAQFVRTRAADIQLHKKDVAGRPGGTCAFLGR